MEVKYLKSNLLVTLSASIWGTSFVVIRWGLEYIDPLSFVFLRFLVATILLFPLMILKKRSIKQIIKKKEIILIGFFNAISFFFQYLGQDLTTAGKAAIFVNFYVIIVPLIAPFFLNEKRNLNVIIAAIMGIIGVFFVSTNMNLSSLTNGRFLGDLLTFISTIGWAGYVIASKRYFNDSNKNNPLDVFFGSIFWNSLFLSPSFAYSLFFNAGQPIRFSFQFLLSLFYLVLFCTIGAFLIYLHALNLGKAGESSIFLLIEIVVAFILEIILSFLLPSIFTNVIPGKWSIVGIFTIILAIIITTITPSNSKNSKKLSNRDKL